MASDDSSDNSSVRDYRDYDDSEEENCDLSHLGAAAPTTSVTVQDVETKYYRTVETGIQDTFGRMIRAGQVEDPGMRDAISQGSSRNAVVQMNLMQVQQNFVDVTLQGATNVTIGGTQNIVATTSTLEENKMSPVAEKIHNINLPIIVSSDGILKIPQNIQQEIKPPSNKKLTLQDLELMTLKAKKEKYEEETRTFREKTVFYNLKGQTERLKIRKLEIEIEILLKKSINEQYKDCT